MRNDLQRVTTTYSADEDRMRLTGELADATVVEVWLTHRLLRRLLPALCQCFDQQGMALPSAEMLHSFAQQAARAELAPQAPVGVTPDSQAWCAHSVDVTRFPEALLLTFRSAAGEHACLTLSALHLRQWLNIVHDHYLKAEWPLDDLPAWLRAPEPAGPDAALVLH